MIEELSTEKLKSTEGSWISPLTRSFLENWLTKFLKTDSTHTQTNWYKINIFFPFTYLLVGNILRYKTSGRNEESVWKPGEIHPVVGNSPKANLWSLILNVKVI